MEPELVDTFVSEAKLIRVFKTKPAKNMSNRSSQLSTSHIANNEEPTVRLKEDFVSTNAKLFKFLYNAENGLQNSPNSTLLKLNMSHYNITHEKININTLLVNNTILETVLSYLSYTQLLDCEKSFASLPNIISYRDRAMMKYILAVFYIYK